VKNRHGVWNIDNPLVLGNLGDKVAVNQVVGDRHTNAENETVGVALEHWLHVSLGLTVEGTIKVGEIFFGETDARSQRMSVVVLEDATSGIDSAMDVTDITTVSNVQSSDDIGTDSLRLVVLAPINVGATGDASSHENVRRLDLIKLSGDVFAILNPSI